MEQAIADARNRPSGGFLDSLGPIGWIIGAEDFAKCFGEGDAVACLWAGSNVIPGSTIARTAVRTTNHVIDGVRAADDVVEEATTVARACGMKSFAGTTLVLMADGTRKAIEDIEVGDKLIATDPVTGEQAAKAVTHVWVHEDTLVDLEVDGATITTTEDHPFWNASEQEFQDAAAIDTGDSVLTADGRLLTVGGLDDASTYDGYNLTVADIHTYHVGEDDILVNNTNDCAPAMLDDTSEAYIRARHMEGGADVTSDKSVFDSGVDLDALVERANDCHCTPSSYGRSNRDADAGTIIGRLSENEGGLPTTWYRVAQDRSVESGPCIRYGHHDDQ